MCLYGSGAAKVSETVSKDSDEPFTLHDAQDAIDQYFDTFSQLKKWLDKMKKEIQTHGFLYTSFGRKRRLKNVFSPDKGIASHEVRSGINASIQSLASDINLLAFIEITSLIKQHKLDAKIFMLVHDSIVAEVREDHVEQYKVLLAEATQRDRGFSIQGKPIGIDQDVHDDYSFGSFEKKFGDDFDRFVKDPLSFISSEA